MAKLDDEDWFVCCSDEEKYTSTGCKKGKLEWTPKPDIMIQLFEQIDKGEKEGNCLYLTESSLNLEWKCPGRRPPTPSDDSEMEDEYDDEDDIESNDSNGGTRPGSLSASIGGASKQADISKTKNDFDFDTEDDGMLSTPRGKLQLTSANKELRGSARKKTTDLSSILSNMKRHKRLGEIEQNKEAAAAALSNSDAQDEGLVAGAINSIMTDSNDSVS